MGRDPTRSLAVRILELLFVVLLDCCCLSDNSSNVYSVVAILVYFLGFFDDKIIGR